MQNNDQAFEAALVQWTPLIERVSFHAAKRAAGMGSVQRVDDFRQILRMTLDRALKSYDPNKGAKLITFLWRAFYNEVNKELGPEDKNAKIAGTYSGDSFFTDDAEVNAAWEYVEDDTERSQEFLYMDAELQDYVNKRLKGPAKAVFGALVSNNQLVGAQLRAYNCGVELEAAEGGMRRFTLDLDLPFVCRLFGLTKTVTARIAAEIRTHINAYGNPECQTDQAASAAPSISTPPPVVVGRIVSSRASARLPWNKTKQTSQPSSRPCRKILTLKKSKAQQPGN